MPTILFVHGINVRGTAWFATLDLVSKKSEHFLPGYELCGCGWGDAYGALLHRDGASIPTYTATGDATTASDRANRARWYVLSTDPLTELRMLPTPSYLGVKPGDRILQLILTLDDQQDVLQLLGRFGIAEPWPPFLQTISASHDWETVIRSVTLGAAAASDFVARAITAAYMKEVCRLGFPELSGDQRDQLQVALVSYVGGPPLAPGFDWAKRWATRLVADRRGALTDSTTPLLGDIIHYQTRGEMIRNFIAEKVRETSATILLAHSLGGIACVDWLASCAQQNLQIPVTHLITVGSQSGYFYEVDAHLSMPFGSGLPDGFPGKWLNIYDPMDLLSYLAAPIFPGHVADHKVDNGQPFPASHGAYWQNDAVWNKIALFLETA